MSYLKRSTWFLAALVVATLVVAVPPAMAAPATYPVELERVGTFAAPVDIQAPAGDSRLFVVERAGRIKIVKNGSTLTTPFLDISGPVGGGSENGLFGLAFHPDYASNGRFFVHYVDSNRDTRVAEYRVSSNPDRANAASGTTLLTFHQPTGRHNGGTIAFGPAGLLYVGFGDGGESPSTQNQAENPNSYFGSLIRIDVDAGSPYAIPAGNPYANGGGKPEIWAIGLRNPWRFAFDPEPGLLYIADVGQNRREEINIEPATSAGLHYGWDAMEGTLCFEPMSGCNTTGKKRPKYQISHPTGQSITGGVVYRGNDIPEIRGMYFYADYVSNWIRSFRYRNGSITAHHNWTTELGRYNDPVAFGVDGFGEMYVASLNGKVDKFVRKSPARCDFDGDGFDDQAIGVPDESIGSRTGAGAIEVLYGSKSGLRSTGSQFFSQNSAGLEGAAEANDHFGSALACGDFDGDGFSDLGVGVPGEALGAVEDVGVVQVLYGSGSGLSTSGDDWWHQDLVGLEGAAEAGDGFGSSLTAGDFDGDGFSDLGVGVPGEALGAVEDVGVVQVLYGSGSGLSTSGDDWWHQDLVGLEGAAEAGDGFGSSLTAGDFDGDGFSDLGVGVPGEALGAVEDVGVVQVLYGSGSGLSTSGDDWWHQDLVGLEGAAEAGDGFGSSLTAGDFDGDGFSDLGVGVPGEALGAVEDVGVVQVLYGSGSGLSTSGDDWWHQDLVGLEGAAEAGDGFGSSLTAGDFDGDGFSDLGVGVPGEALGAVEDVGVVQVLYGSGSGLSTSGDDWWHQDLVGLEGAAEAGDGFGSSLTAGDFDGDGFSDLGVGVPGEALGAVEDVGVVQVLYGSGSGLSTSGDDWWHQDRNGIAGNAEPGDHFGAAVS